MAHSVALSFRRLLVRLRIHEVTARYGQQSTTVPIDRKEQLVYSGRLNSEPRCKNSSRRDLDVQIKKLLSPIYANLLLYRRRSGFFERRDQLQNALFAIGKQHQRIIGGKQGIRDAGKARAQAALHHHDRLRSVHL